MKFFKTFGVGCALIGCVTATMGADFGTHGQVYKITEKNALDAIYEKLKAMEKTGELAKRKKKQLIVQCILLKTQTS
jgi:conjugal transfer pilus assembly protein TraW